MSDYYYIIDLKNYYEAQTSYENELIQNGCTKTRIFHTIVKYAYERRTQTRAQQNLGSQMNAYV